MPTAIRHPTPVAPPKGPEPGPTDDTRLDLATFCQAQVGPVQAVQRWDGAFGQRPSPAVVNVRATGPGIGVSASGTAESPQVGIAATAPVVPGVVAGVAVQTGRTDDGKEYFRGNVSAGVGVPAANVTCGVSAQDSVGEEEPGK